MSHSRGTVKRGVTPNVFDSQSGDRETVLYRFDECIDRGIAQRGVVPCYELFNRFAVLHNVVDLVVRRCERDGPQSISLSGARVNGLPFPGDRYFLRAQFGNCAFFQQHTDGNQRVASKVAFTEYVTGPCFARQ